MFGRGGGTQHFFLLNLYNFKNIGGGGMCPPAPLLCGPCQHAVNTSIAEEVLAKVSDWDCNIN